MELTVHTKIGADSLARNTPKCPIIYLLNLSAQAQKFRISMIFANICKIEKEMFWTMIIMILIDHLFLQLIGPLDQIVSFQCAVPWR